MARILLVEDERKLLRMLTEVFAEEGHTVQGFRQVEDAEAVLEAGRFDLVVTDVRLPRRSGIELLVRAGEVDPDLPVIVISAYATRSGAREAMRLGAYDYVVKPFSLHKLVKLASRALGERGGR